MLIPIIISLHWTSAEIGAYGFGFDFGVRAGVHACVRNHILDKYGLILFVLGTKTTHDGIHMHIIFFRHQIQDGQLGSIFVIKKLLCQAHPQPC